MLSVKTKTKPPKQKGQFSKGKKTNNFIIPNLTVCGSLL